ncbi:MAG: hypothetical protein ABIB93_05485, partial [Chloroflexota bacterium]
PPAAQAYKTPDIKNKKHQKMLVSLRALAKQSQATKEEIASSLALPAMTAYVYSSTKNCNDR